MSDEHRVEPPRPLPIVGFEPAGMPRAERASDIEVVGELLRGHVRQLAFLPDGTLLVVAGGRVERLDPETLERLDTWLEGSPPTRLHVLADGRILVHTDDRVAWARYGEAPALVITGAGPMDRIDVTPDGTIIACPTPRGVTLHDADGRLTRTLTAEGLRYENTQASVSVSPTGKYVARWDHSDGRIWRDGDVITRTVRGLKGSPPEPFEEQQPYDFKEAVFLSDTHAIAAVYDVCVWDLAAMEPIAKLHRDWDRGGVSFEWGRIVGTDGYGGHTEVDAESYVMGTPVEAQPQHYGAQGMAVAPAMSPTHVATHAPTFGTIHVTGPKGTVVREGHLQGLEELTVSADGQRLAAMSPYRERGYGFDRATRESREVVSVPGMQGLGLSDDGQDLIFASGVNLRARLVHVIPFEGGEAVATHKSMNWSRGTVGFGGRMYAHAVYNLKDNGWVGIYEVGSKRAAAKLKAFPWRFAISRNGRTAAVAGTHRSDPGVRLFDLARKGRERDRIEDAQDVALGSDYRHVAVLLKGDPRRLRIRTRGGSVDVDLETPRGNANFGLAYAEDDSLVFVSTGRGIEARRSDTGDLVTTLPCSCPNENLVIKAGLLWALGKDGVIRAYGVPGEAPREPSGDETAAEPETAPVPEPMSSTASAQGVPSGQSFELGERTLTIRETPTGPGLFDGDTQLKSLRKRKADDADVFARLKDAWAAARHQD